MFYSHKETNEDGTINYQGLKYKPRVRHGKTYVSDAETVGTHAFYRYNAHIDAKHGKITLHGWKKSYGANINGIEPYHITFKVGDQAEYDSYNLQYLGEIVKITDKCVTIVAHKGHQYNEESRRLSITDFARRNCDFDLEQIKKSNHEISMSI